MKSIRVLALIAAALLAACSDESTTEKIVEVTSSGVDVVSDISMLPDCGKSNDRELVWVKGETTPRICSEGKWYAVAEGSVSATCFSEPLADGSGIKVICGGDSIGVLLNGMDGKDGAQGQQGEKGAAGEAGASGDTGNGGNSGTDGKDGKNGTDGKDGAPGENGKDGADGKDGAPGANGKDGKDGNDGTDGTSCSLKKIDENVVRVICGNDSTELYAGELPDTVVQGEIELDSEKIAVSLDEVSGLTQKGPFLKGSAVLVREMEDGRTLTQTGYSFNGKIMNDRGEFKVNARMLVSQYVMLEATGYYRNEVTGENSNSALTLFAITDVNDRNTVNVNLLTHLEYERVIYLVTQKKMKVRAAKKQAQKEVFALLHIDATNFSNSEDLNIAGASDEDAALLAFSIILQGDRSESELSELLTKIATDMEEDGIWDDSASRASMADWAALVDSTDGFAKIRRNVENWKLSSAVPHFEKYMQKFWTTEYGIGECSEANVGAVVASKKAPFEFCKGSLVYIDDSWPQLFACVENGDTTVLDDSWQRRYVCQEDRLWHFATDAEKDMYLWHDTTDGAIKPGNVTGKIYVFDSLGIANGHKGWREADEEERLYGGCNKSLFGAYRKNLYPTSGYDENGQHYHQYLYIQCQESAHDWVVVNEEHFPMIDTQDWSDGEDGESRWGDSVRVAWGVDLCYVYDTSAANKGWNLKYVDYSDRDCSLGIGGCNERRAGQTVKANDDNYYACRSGWSWNIHRAVEEYHYLWQTVTSRVAENTESWACLDSNDGEIRLGKEGGAYFVCEDYAWRDATTDEERDCRENGVCNISRCTERKKGKFKEIDDVLYVCNQGRFGYDDDYEDYRWRTANCAEIKSGRLCMGRDSVVVWACEEYGGFQIDYVCYSDAWRPVSTPSDYTPANWNKKKAEYYTQETHPDAVYGEDLVDARDGNVYKTVFIGGKRWMAENLRYADSVETPNMKSVKGYYDYIKQFSCDTQGCEYSWTAAMDIDSKWQWIDSPTLPERIPSSVVQAPHRGICPNGWHVPDTTEWKMLEEFGAAGLQMRGYRKWENATDASGFSALPVCSDYYSGNICTSSFWSISEYDGRYDCAYIWKIEADTVAFATDYESGKGNQLPIRCIQDDP